MKKMLKDVMDKITDWILTNANEDSAVSDIQINVTVENGASEYEGSWRFFLE